MQRLLSLFLLMLLAACATSDKPETYLYAPPLTAGGRLCLIQCQQAKAYCAETCDTQRTPCFQAKQMAMIKAYENYAREQGAQHLPLTKKPAEFMPQDECLAPACNTNCLNGYNRCYTACGGEVTTASGAQAVQ